MHVYLTSFLICACFKLLLRAPGAKSCPGRPAMVTRPSSDACLDRRDRGRNLGRYRLPRRSLHRRGGQVPVHAAQLVAIGVGDDDRQRRDLRPGVLVQGRGL